MHTSSIVDCCIAFAVIYFVVFMERGQRRIVVNYAKRQQGRKVFAAQSTHLPKINMAGVIPTFLRQALYCSQEHWPVVW